MRRQTTERGGSRSMRGRVKQTAADACTCNLHGLELPTLGPINELCDLYFFIESKVTLMFLRYMIYMTFL